MNIAASLVDPNRRLRPDNGQPPPSAGKLITSKDRKAMAGEDGWKLAGDNGRTTRREGQFLERQATLSILPFWGRFFEVTA